MHLSVGTAALKWDVHPLAYDNVPAVSAWSTAARGPELPVLLVLDSTVTGVPWRHAIARASQTLQVHDIARRFGDPGVRATFAYARDFQRVGRIVLGREGRGELIGAARVRFFDDLCALADEHDLPVDGAWHALDTGRLFIATAGTPSFAHRKSQVDPLTARLFAASTCE